MRFFGDSFTAPKQEASSALHPYDELKQIAIVAEIASLMDLAVGVHVLSFRRDSVLFFDLKGGRVSHLHSFLSSLSVPL